MEDRAVETMEEVLREEALPLLLRRLRPVVLHPLEVLELEDKADMGREGTDRVVTEEMEEVMEEVMEEEVATAEEATEVATGVV